MVRAEALEFPLIALYRCARRLTRGLDHAISILERAQAR